MDIKNDGYLHEIAFNTNGDKMVICSSSQKILFFTKKKARTKNEKKTINSILIINRNENIKIYR